LVCRRTFSAGVTCLLLRLTWGYDLPHPLCAISSHHLASCTQCPKRVASARVLILLALRDQLVEGTDGDERLA
jgi:hypothetical protein